MLRRVFEVRAAAVKTSIEKAREEVMRYREKNALQMNENPYSGGKHR